MKLRKYVLTFVLALLCAVAMPSVAMAAETSGSCGTSATWSYNNGTLTISGKGVVDDNPWLKPYKNSITKVVITEGITSIDKSSAFDGCDSLASVSLPDSLTKLSFYAFKSCDSLKTITIPKNLKECGGYSFKSSGLETVTFAEGTTAVPGSIFIDCSNLKTINFVDTITTIGPSAFENCDSLTTVKLPQGLSDLGFYAFKACDGITEITIPKSVVKCGGYCFKSSALQKVTFEDGATVIPSSMFADCTQLKEIVLPQSIKKLEASAFDNCDALTKFVCPYYLESIGFYTFKNCDNLKEITIYQNVKSIDTYAFKYIEKLTIYGKKNSEAHKYAKKNGYTFKTCKVPALKGITYTKGNLKYKVVTDYINGKGTVMVTGMKKNASSVTIPKTVKLESYNYKVVKIEKNAFKNKKKLKKITIKSTYLTSVGKNAIKGIDKKATIKVPKSKLPAYKKLFKASTGYKKTMKIKK